MDLMRKILEVSHQEYLREESGRRYPIDDPNDDEEVKMMMEFRETFIRDYDKVNNRLFCKTKIYRINEYKESIVRYEKREEREKREKREKTNTDETREASV